MELKTQEIGFPPQNYTSLSFLCYVTKGMSIPILSHLCIKRLPPTKPFITMLPLQSTQYVTNKSPKFMSSATPLHWEMPSQILKAKDYFYHLPKKTSYTWILGHLCGFWNVTVCAVDLEVVRPDLSLGCQETPFVAFLPSFSFVSPVETIFWFLPQCVCVLRALIFVFSFAWFHSIHSITVEWYTLVEFD